MERLIRSIDALLAGIGRVVALLVLVMIGVTVMEMAGRGLFAHPTPWAHELSSWLLTAFIFLGGPYALSRGQFVRVDVFHEHYGPRMRAIVDTCVSTIVFVLFAYALIWVGGKFALSSFAMDERSATGGWGGPVWVAKAMMPIGSVLLCLAWLSHILKLWRDVGAGRTDTPPVQGEG